MLNLNLSSLDPNNCIISDTIDVYKIIARKRRELLYEKADVSIYSNRIEINKDNNKIILLFNDILSAGIFGRNKLNIFTESDTYQFKNDKRFNPMKYLHFIYKAKQEKGDIKDEFFGI